MKPETLAKNKQRPSVRLTLSSVGPAALGERRRMLKLKPGQAVADRTEAAIFGATNQNQLTWPMEWGENEDLQECSARRFEKG